MTPQNPYLIRPFHPDAQPGFDQNISFALPDIPLCVEIGCGAGMHPIQFAHSHPDRMLVAIEHTRNKFQSFIRTLQQQPEPPNNLLALHTNAITWISKCLPAASVDQYFLLYPNPWPKAKQRNQRWHRMPFMHKVIETMKPGATLTLATNMAFYAEEAADFFQHAWGLQLTEFQPLSLDTNPNLPLRTHFEKKYLERGETCFNLVLTQPAVRSA